MNDNTNNAGTGYNRAIGAEVRRLRGKTSQIDIAAAMGIPNYQLSKLETGRSEWTLDLIFRAARALKVPVKRLYRVVESVHEDGASRAAS